MEKKLNKKTMLKSLNKKLITVQNFLLMTIICENMAKSFVNRYHGLLGPQNGSDLPSALGLVSNSEAAMLSKIKRRHFQDLLSNSVNLEGPLLEPARSRQIK